MTDIDTEVLIVGAGPTGLALAATLAARGVSTEIIDRGAAGANTSRAAVIHAGTLDVLDPLGLAEPLIRQGLIVPRFTVRHADRVLMTIDFDHIGSPHPYTLMLPQDHTERTLAQALPFAVRRDLAVERVSDNGCDVSVVCANSAGDRTTVRCRWLVGADGMHSTVRSAAGIPFVGESYPETFLLADVRLTWPIPRTQVELFLAPDGLVVVAPLPGEDRFRIVATTATANPRLDAAGLQQLIDDRGPKSEPGHLTDVLWSSKFLVHHRLAARFRLGNIFLAGDAAHVHSPAGGQGMNLGIQDAVDLGNTLADFTDDPTIDLDGYQARRRPRAEHIVRLTDRLTKAAVVQHSAVRTARDLVITGAGRLPVVPRRLARQLAGL